MDDDHRLAERVAFVAKLPAPQRPPIVVPDEGCAGAEEVFRHLDPAAIPEVAQALDWLMANRPEVIAAVADVDRTLIWDALDRSPLENLAHAERLASNEAALRATLSQGQHRLMRPFAPRHAAPAPLLA